MFYILSLNLHTIKMSLLDYDIDDDEEGVAFATLDYDDGGLPLYVSISHDTSIDTSNYLSVRIPMEYLVKTMCYKLC